MPKDLSAPSMGLQERSASMLETGEKFSKWVFFSFLFHLALVGALFIIPMLPKSQVPSYPVYTVDLVGGEKIGRANLGTELKSSPAIKETPKKESPAPIQETKREIKKEKAEKAKPIEKTPVEKPVLLPD